MSNKNGVEKKPDSTKPKQGSETPAEGAESKRPAVRPTTQSINDEDRAAGEGMGQQKYGPPPSNDP